MSSVSVEAAAVPLAARTSEVTYKRFSSIGVRWNINADWRQIDAINFKVSKALRLSGVG
jgi:hypothetical protein